MAKKTTPSNTAYRAQVRREVNKQRREKRIIVSLVKAQDKRFNKKKPAPRERTHNKRRDAKQTVREMQALYPSTNFTAPILQDPQALIDKKLLFEQKRERERRDWTI